MQRIFFETILTLDMSKTHTIRKGLNLPLVGAPSAQVEDFPLGTSFAVYPDEFVGVTPKLALNEGDVVKAGQCLFYDKKDPRIQITSPVSGTLQAIVRGDKRRLVAIRLTADAVTSYHDFGTGLPTTAEEVKTKLLASGAWTLLEMRPYARVANPDDAPKAIFINGMATAPFATEPAVALAGRETAFTAGLKALNLLAPKTILSIHANEHAPMLVQAEGVEIHRFAGKHPAGNTSVHIAQVSPLNKGEVVWTISAADVAIIGDLFLKGTYCLDRVMSVAGSGIQTPQYYRLRGGMSLEAFFSSKAKTGAYRYISGSVLTGQSIGAQGYLGVNAQQITVIPEGQGTDFLGWVLPGFGKYSVSRTFFSFLTPGKKYDLSTKLNGEERAFVVTGQYDTVFPFDIYPNQLLKAVWAKDLEKMEELGIYEVVPEDFALCEVICTSKQPLQGMVREALDILHTEMN
ncbi:MAG TPA: NADH:ubiquinone reductase (Na(+)-transporting) subunit A [Cryomorphaceae bacterium]|nr:NADH:ubiquinone reductase (Na(+)-transporting) subunit A [Cryomorphaceae bacterium]